MLKQSDSSLVIFSDGGSRGNPGPAASSYLIFSGEEIIKQDSKYLGITTNNIAEYTGVVMALSYVAENHKNKNITYYMDSELVVKQLTGVYKIKNEELIKLFKEIKKIIAENNLKIQFKHVLREKNKLADKLVNEKLDESSRH